MRRVIPLIALTVALAGWSAMPRAHAQAVPKSLQESGPEQSIRARKNAWTIGVAGGLIDGTYMRFADELAKALDDGDNLRILPIVSYGAASNLEDLLYLHGVDVAVTQADVFEYFRTERRTPNQAGRVHYILRLPISELHVLARDDIRTIHDLKGKKVNFGPPGSGSSLTGTIVFQRLGIPVEQVMINQSSALQQLKSGEVSALVRVVNKPVEFFAKMPPGSGLHLLSVPFSKSMEDYYGVGEFTDKDYPTLVPTGERIDTIAVPAVLAVYNWAPNTERYRKVERFVDRLFNNWDKFQKPPFHPKWQDINLTATVPGWTRFAVAERMLQQAAGKNAQQDALGRDFQKFLRASGVAVNNTGDNEALFRQFLDWQRQQRKGANQN
jgi:TRAP-type uncharacterized transport system substrate-binding protein